LTACATESTDDTAATTAEAGGDRSEPATEHSEGADDTAATAQAADLRAGLNTLLAEHVFFAGAAVNEALQGNTAGFEAAAGALDENSVALSEAVGSVYGPEAGEAFLGLWRSHIGMFVDYTQATAAGDKAAQDKAVADLTGYANDFAVFLSGANPNLPEETVEQLVVEHVVSTKDAVDALASGDAAKGFSEFREAIAHMHMIGDPLSAAIAQQFPEQFSTGTSEAASALRTQLNVKLAEHVWLAGAAVNEAAKGNTAAFEAAAGALDGNSQDLAGMVGSVYGPEAGEAFLGLWRAHIGMFVDYTQGKLAGDDAKAAKAEQDLAGYSRDFAVFLNGANDNLPVEDVQALLEEHVASTKGAIDAVVGGEGNPFVALREAGQHMSHIADPLAAAIATQQNL
ncbi:MAG TPA: hypothetical protein VNU01_08300, partial [Egibacteraceae bacterium]|nr:hypothetical protein [Egibacteraceae bacterium]